MYGILLVEDERWVRAGLRRVVEQTGLPFRVVHESENGLEALDWLKQNRADLVLTDIRMPVMDGLALAERLREAKDAPEVIIISGHDDFEYAQKALRSRVFDYLLKPVEAEDLRKVLNGWLKRESQRQNAEPSDGQAAPAAEELSTVERVIQFVRSAMPGEVTLAEAAAHVHLNASYLSHLFKQQTGRNFVDFVLEQRMEAAKRLLADTALRVSEIAQRLGYSDIAYFSNTFKKWTGLTPSEYRKQAAQETKRVDIHWR
jgi:YesN/AraC family two-component response regulator